MSAQSSSSGFRLQGTRFFLTFPQCDKSPDEAQQALKDLLKDKYKSSIVAQEKHEDGSPHLHIYVEVLKRMNISNAAYWDVVGGKHGNYQAVRNADAVKRYVTKESPGVNDGVQLPADRKLLVYANVISLAADLAKKRPRPDTVTFDEAVADLITEGYVFANSCARLDYEWAKRAFKVRVTGKINVQDVRHMFK